MNEEKYPNEEPTLEDDELGAIDRLHEHLAEDNAKLLQAIAAEGAGLPAPHPFIIGRIEALVDVVFSSLPDDTRHRFEVLTEKKINEQLTRYLGMVRRARLLAP